MFREIKFRAWTNKGEEYEYRHGMMYDLAFNEFAPVNDHLNSVNTWGVLMQYTGLKDRNGTEIYEGDIVRYFNKCGHHTEFSKRFVVEFGQQDLGHASYQQTIGWNATPIDQYGKESLMDSGRLSHGLLDLFGCHCVEVIGNIYENSDLLDNN